jgi:hypothetical protein
MVWEALACEMPDHIAGVMSMTSIQVGAVVMSSAFGSIPFTIAPGAVIADVARRHDLAPQHLSNWIRAAKDGQFALPADETSKRSCARFGTRACNIESK